MKNIRQIPLPIQTLFSDLEQQSYDADFNDTFRQPGKFKKSKRGNRYYWYWTYRDGKTVRNEYVGPVTDKEISQRVAHFNDLKSDYDNRASLVKTLVRSGLPATDNITGAIIEAITLAGFFRLRGVLVGTTAFQCYSGLLGARLKGAALRTQDADLAQFFAIAQQLDDSMPPILDVLKKVDPTFRPVPRVNSTQSCSFINSDGYRVEFLTPNRGRDDYQDRPATMPALGGVSAQPLRFLDFLIREPIRSVLLHGAGIPVTIPSPERYLVHKIIISDRRHEISRSKALKDIEQAETLIKIMHERHFAALSMAWQEAWKRGPSWRKALGNGIMKMEESIGEALKQAVLKGLKKRKKEPESIWPSM